MPTHNPPNLTELLQRLQPIIDRIVQTSVQEAMVLERRVHVSSGVVTDVENDLAHVRMDDGGIANAPTPGIIQCTRMSTSVVASARVRVHFYPGMGPEAHPVAGV